MYFKTIVLLLKLNILLFYCIFSLFIEFIKKEVWKQSLFLYNYYSYRYHFLRKYYFEQTGQIVIYYKLNKIEIKKPYLSLESCVRLTSIGCPTKISKNCLLKNNHANSHTNPLNYKF